MSIRERLVISFFYFKSLLKEKNYYKVKTGFNNFQQQFSSFNLDLLEKLLYNTIFLIIYGNTGRVKQELTLYKETQILINANREYYLNSKDIFWYFYFTIISANIEMKQKNYSVSYDMLKQVNKHFIDIKEKSRLDMIILSSIHMLLGKMHKEINYMDIAVNNFNTVIEWALKAKNLDNTRAGYINLALTYEELGRDYLAFKTSKEFLEQVKEKFDDDQYSLSSGYNLLGNLFNRSGDFEVAKDYYLRAFSVITNSDLLQKVRSFNLNNMGVISFKLGNYLEALSYYSHALQLAIIKQDPGELAFYYSNIGEVNLVLNMLQSAFENELQAISYLEKVKNDDLLVETYFILVRICLEQNTLEKADIYIENIHQMFLTTKRKIFKYKYLISKAIKLSKEGKYVESKEVFLSILDNPNLSFDLQGFALTELIKMLLDSIIHNHSNDFTDLDEIIKKLSILGKQNKSLPIICNLAILESRINLLQSKYDSAEAGLKNAIDFCVERNVEYFKSKLQYELEFLYELKESNPESVRSLLINKIGSNESLGSIKGIQRLISNNLS